MNLKPITREGIPSALKKVERYRLLNDAVAAESICLDVLDLDPDHQDALDALVLTISDQLEHELSEGVARARKLLPRIHDEYRRNYLNGILCERRGKAQLNCPAEKGFASAVTVLRVNEAVAARKMLTFDPAEFVV